MGLSEMDVSYFGLKSVVAKLPKLNLKLLLLFTVFNLVFDVIPVLISKTK